MSLVIVSSPRFRDHRTPAGHPEQTARADVMDAIASAWRDQGAEVVAPREATREQLVRVHDPEYLDTIDATAGRAVALDPDTYTSPESRDVARLAAGAAIDAVERVLAGPTAHGRTQAALALVRPPGHHAERSRAMGFCLYNNVAVAAAHARTLGAGRVAIVDYDVHHGNGTQHVFELDPSVLYISLHQFPFYPGTGAASDVGRGDGTGYTVNLPLAAGAIDDDYRVAFERVVVPVLYQFAPDLLLVSAGFDAHERDPLAEMRLSTAAFAAMTAHLRLVAEACAAGRLALVTEGGYDLQALAACLDAVAGALTATEAEPAWPESGLRSRRGQEAVEAARRALDGSWQLE